MSIYFVTGNKNKFKEAKRIISNLKQVDIDLPEIQEIDAREVVKFKLLEALKYQKSEFVVEDTSLHLDCLGGLPGPLIKWFLSSIGGRGVYELTKKMGNNRAEARTIVGYAKSLKDIYYFSGSIKGEIVFPRTKSSFGWDPIFKPDGFSKSFAAMSLEEKNDISMRKIAFSKLKDFLNKESSAN